MHKTFIGLIGILAILFHAIGQDFSCKNGNYEFLAPAIGDWEVATKDRIAVGEYEENIGTATVRNAIEGCGISISFRGTYKGNPYARESIITGHNNGVQMVAMDSEHGKFSTYDGTINDQKLEMKWYRNKEVGKLQSKYVLQFENEDAFTFSSFLSTDYGESWALTHERIFKRKQPSQKPVPTFLALIVSDIDQSIEWYDKVLGFELVNKNVMEERGLKMANLKAGKSRLELIEMNASIPQHKVLSDLPPKTKLQGFFKFGFESSNLAQVVKKLQLLDPQFNETIVKDPMTGKDMIVFKDPDGNRIQLFEE